MYRTYQKIFLFFIGLWILPGWAQALTAQEIYTKVAGSVYLIKSSSVGRGTEYGSAVAITNNVLATNCHVALFGTGLLINTDKDKLPGQVVYADRAHDLCLVKVEGAQFKPVTLRPAATANIGEEVYAIGNPDGLQRTISRGIISNRFMTRAGLILQTDAAISPGSSGGGLFDNQANLLGLTTSKSKIGENIGFVLPSELITTALANKDTWHPETILADQQAATTSSATDITSNYFGKDKVALVAKQNKCFLLFQGQDVSGTTVSLMLWDPQNPKAFLVFPFATNLTSLEQELNQFNSSKQDSLQFSKDVLVFNTGNYPLVGNPVGGKFVVLFAGVDINPENYLRGGQYLLVQMDDDKGARGYKSVRFGLNGVPEALAAYDQQCR